MEPDNGRPQKAVARIRFCAPRAWRGRPPGGTAAGGQGDIQKLFLYLCNASLSHAYKRQKENRKGRWT